MMQMPGNACARVFRALFFTGFGGAMIEKIIDWSARNRFIVILVYLVVIGFGVHAVISLPVYAIPDLSENQVIVTTEWMGHSPEIWRRVYAQPLGGCGSRFRHGESECPVTRPLM
jgi:hypothetical protein